MRYSVGQLCANNYSSDCSRTPVNSNYEHCMKVELAGEGGGGGGELSGAIENIQFAIAVWGGVGGGGWGGGGGGGVSNYRGPLKTFNLPLPCGEGWTTSSPKNACVGGKYTTRGKIWPSYRYTWHLVATIYQVFWSDVRTWLNNGWSGNDSVGGCNMSRE